MMPSALRPLVVPFASARKGRERPHAHCIERITWKLWGEEAKYCNPWKLWTRQNAGRDPYPWTSSCPCVTFSFFWSCRGTCVSPVSSFFIQWHILPLGSGSLCGCFVLCFSTWGEGGGWIRFDAFHHGGILSNKTWTNIVMGAPAGTPPYSLLFQPTCCHLPVGVWGC